MDPPWIILLGNCRISSLHNAPSFLFKWSVWVFSLLIFHFSLNCVIRVRLVAQKVQEKKRRMESSSNYSFSQIVVRSCGLFSTLFTGLPYGKRIHIGSMLRKKKGVERRKIPFAGCVNGTGGVGYGARGTGIVILAKVFVLCQALKSLLPRSQKASIFLPSLESRETKSATMHMLR